MTFEKQFDKKLKILLNSDDNRITSSKTPSLIIGLGGTGINTLLRIKNEVQTRMVTPKDFDGKILGYCPENIAFLAFDSDKEQLLHSSFDTAELEADEIVDISVDFDNFVESVDDVFSKQMHNVDNDIFDWCDSELTSEIHGSKSYNQIRQFGRLMLFLNIDNIRSRLVSTIEKLLVKTDTNDLKVYIITGTCGETSSGIFLDMAYIVRTIAQTITPNFSIFGYVFTPDLNKSSVVDDASLFTNGFASLKELDYWMTSHINKENFIQRYSSDFVVNSFHRPFDFCHLVTSYDANCDIVSYQEALDLAANFIFTQISCTSDFSMVYQDAAVHLVYSQKPYPANYNYISIGYNGISVPTKEIATLIAARTFEALSPLLKNSPSNESFTEDLNNLGLNNDQIFDFIKQGVEIPYSKIVSFTYQDLFPLNNLEALCERWLSEAKVAIYQNKSDFSSVHEEIFKEYISKIFRDPAKGPCYVADLICSNARSSLVKSLELLRDDCIERLTSISSKSEKLYYAAQQSFSEGMKVGIFGRRNATQECIDAYSAWLSNELYYYVYEATVDALNEYISVLEKYSFNFFKGFKEDFCYLPRALSYDATKIRQTTSDAEQHQKLSSRYIIGPVEFEKKYFQEICNKIIAVDEDFLNFLYTELCKFLGSGFKYVDSEQSQEFDLWHCAADFINNRFSDLFAVGVNDLINEKFPDEDSRGESIKEMLEELCNDSIPLFYIDSRFTSLDTKMVSLAFIPNDCEDMLALSKDFTSSTGSNLYKYNDRNNLTWIKMVIGVPLFAFPEITKMEECYEYAMNTSIVTSRGVHLRREWYEQLLSPLPEQTRTSDSINSTYKEYSKEHNDLVRNAFNKCLQFGIICSEAVDKTAKLYIADESKLSNIEIRGSATERKEQLDILQTQIWNDNSTAINIYPIHYTIAKSSLDEILASVLRFHSLSQEIKKQIAVFDRFKSISRNIVNVELYVEAILLNLINFDGVGYTFRRLELDSNPVKLYDNSSESPYREYEAFTAFDSIIDQLIVDDINYQFDKFKKSIYTPDKNIDSMLVADKIKLLTDLNNVLNVEYKVLDEELKRFDSELSCNLVDFQTFYNRLSDSVSDHLASFLNQ